MKIAAHIALVKIYSIQNCMDSDITLYQIQSNISHTALIS